MVSPTTDPAHTAVGQNTSDTPSMRRRLGVVWIAGLLVAAGAGVATAHGLFEVALAAGVPQMLAWLYPLITDGLALVAYASTTRLTPHGRRYAWTVVVVAAGLSGLTQAGYLAGGVRSAPAVLRFAIGAWPALAAAIVAHLLYLLTDRHHTPSPHHPHDPTVPPTATDPPPATVAITASTAPVSAAARALPYSATPGNHDHDRLASPAVSRSSPPSVVRPLDTRLDTPTPVEHRTEHPIGHPRQPATPLPARLPGSPAGDRAITVAKEHATRHGRLPTVRELASLARVARGTAATALKDLRTPTTSQPAGKPANEAKRPR